MDKRAILATLAVAFAFPLAGCQDAADDPAIGTPGMSFYGTYTDQAGHAGTVELAALSAMTTSGVVLAQEEGTSLIGELRIAGLPLVTLNGLYDAAAGTLVFSSSDAAYNFNGTVVSSQVKGFGLGPGGPATFVVFLGGTASSVDTFCGTATCTSPPGCEAGGDFNVALSGNEVLMAGSVDGSVTVATGTSSASQLQVTIAQDPLNVTVEGTITGNTISGTWTDTTNGNSGTWSASTSECRTG
ncbi:MAG TPA: hypothetical protein VJ826_07550 [Candidatus Polarisedimenticolaceae bacterium]|nr:hypothetical protein [Candidatus Polarisedimenticolaceae bacterium]